MRTSELFERREVGDPRDWAVCNIIGIQASKGDPLGALQTYNRLPKVSLRQPGILSLIASALVAIGKEDAVEDLSEPQDLRELGPHPLLGIAEGLMKRAEAEARRQAAKDEGKVLTRQDLQSQWDALEDLDAARAYQASLNLRSRPRSAVPFLKERLRPAQGILPVAPRRLAELIAQLDSDSVLVREQAAEELRRLGDQARPALAKAAKDSPSKEGRALAQDVVRQIKIPISAPSVRRDLRAVEVLAHIETPEARELLRSLAKGIPEAQITQAARAALAPPKQEWP